MDILQKNNLEYLCLQETWLFASQQEVAASISKSFEAHSKPVDEDDPEPLLSLLRGYGGVSTLWNNCKHQPASLIDGTNRCVVTKSEFCVLINVYLPCRGSYTNQEFMEELDHLHEICVKYSEEPIILAGDLNVDISKPSDVRAKSIKHFLENNSLEEVKTSTIPTFCHHNGKHASKIDYIFINRNMQRVMESAEYYVLSHLPLNTSSHEPIVLKISLNVDFLLQQCKNSKSKTSKPKWNKCAQMLYEETLHSYLDTDVSPSDKDEAISYLTKVLHLATDKVVPKSKPKVKRKSWNPTIAKLAKECKPADATWKAAGKPNPPDPLFLNRKQSKKKLRSAHCVHVVIERHQNMQS